jgi:AcrR family transcriptional regulator
MNRKVTRQAWIDAALGALAEGGLGAIAIEPLARSLGVTKGSFYNYFAGLDALVDAVLTLWEQEATDAVIARLGELASPQERLTGLFAEAWGRLDHLKMEAALLAAAVAGDPRVRLRYLRMNRKRLEYTTELYRAANLPEAEARRYATTAYGSFLGTLLLVALEGSTFRTQGEVRAHADHLTDLLVPSHRDKRPKRSGRD